MCHYQCVTVSLYVSIYIYIYLRVCDFPRVWIGVLIFVVQCVCWCVYSSAFSCVPFCVSLGLCVYDCVSVFFVRCFYVFECFCVCLC